MTQPIVTNRDEAREKGMLTLGIYFVRVSDNTPLYLPYTFDNRIDLENLLVCSNKENPDWPELNDLIRNGRVKKATIFREYDVILPQFPSRDCDCTFTDKAIEGVIEEFKEHDFNVTREALLHNYEAWLMDYKSGYRDEANGYHLFTACGCNTLYFRASSLENDLDWQDTYIA